MPDYKGKRKNPEKGRLHLGQGESGQTQSRQTQHIEIHGTRQDATKTADGAGKSDC